jgi:hypothetical protein
MYFPAAESGIAGRRPLPPLSKLALVIIMVVL